MDRVNLRRPGKTPIWRLVTVLVAVPAAIFLSFYLVLPDEGLDRDGALGVFLFLVVAVPAMWQFAAQQLRLYRERDRIRTELECTGDAVVVADANGCVEFLSPSAERLTGWTSAEARGRETKAILDLRQAPSGVPLPDPIGCVLARRPAAGRTDQALLVRRDGTEFPVEASAAPILDRGDRLNGAVVVFRDRTEAYVREERAFFTSGPAVMFRRRAAERWPVEYVSPNVTAQFGYRPEEFTGGRLHYLDVVHPADLARVVAGQMQYSVSGASTFDQVYRILAADGGSRWVHDFTRILRNGQGAITHYHGYLLDITGQRRSEADLRLAACVFEHNSEGILITDAQARIIRVNPAFTRITGYEPEEVIGRNPSMLASGRHDRQYFTAIWASILEHGHWRGEIWNRRRNGDVYPQWLAISVVRDPGEGATHYVGVFTDITDYKKAEETIRHLAYHDALTNLPNRPLLMDRLQVALANARRSGHAVAVLFVDLDHFKRVNDTLGHASGDMLLRRAADRLSTCVREGDTIGRIGGDEFVVVLNNVGASDEAREAASRVASKIREAFGSSFRLGGTDLAMTLSIGIALYPSDDDTAEELVRLADLAMYHAKSAGRDNCQFYSRELDVAGARPALESDLRQALERGEFSLFYQPQVAFRSGAFVGAEALLRWRHPVAGLLGAADFIQTAEDSGLILPIGEWVVGEALAQRQRWKEAGIAAVPGLRLAINASPRQLRHGGFAAALRRALADRSLEPGAIEIEVSEHSLLHHSEATLRSLEAFRAMGVGVAIDDFGTGYSALSSLKRFPIDAIKIDRGFVRGLPGDGSDAAVVTAIVGVAKALGLRTIAEGVETRDQFDFLERAGCFAYQGHWFSEAVPAEAMESMLRRAPVAGAGRD